MTLVKINNEHTLDVDRLTGGWVLDVGCRFFDFSACILNLGCRVLAVDPGQGIVPDDSRIVFKQCALVHDERRSAEFCDWSNGTPSHLVYGHRPRTNGVSCYSVSCASIEQLMRDYSIPHFDAVKLDCEGAEFEILANWPGPIATQISAAFHDFVDPEWSRSNHARVLDRLGRWYKTVQHEATVQHGHPVPCHWDSLFTL